MARVKEWLISAAKMFITLPGLSWHPAIASVRKQQLNGKQTKSTKQGPLEKRAVGGKAPQSDLSFLQPVNVVIDGLQFTAVGCAGKFPVRKIGKTAQHTVIGRLQYPNRKKIPIGLPLEFA